MNRQIGSWCKTALLSGALLFSGSVATAQDSKPQETRKLAAVHLDGTYFTHDGKRFIPVGAHWVPAKAAMQWPVQWDPKDIEADFAKMHELGYTIVRFDMVWPWFEPRPGDYNPVAFPKQLDYLVSLAHKYQIYLHPSLFIGGEVAEAYWDVPGGMDVTHTLIRKCCGWKRTWRRSLAAGTRRNRYHRLGPDR